MQFVFPSHLQLGVEHTDGFHQELLRGLTHKLNNLLAVIQGFSSLILMTDDLDPDIAQNMQHIREASVGVASLSERIRTAGGCAKLQMQALNLNEYLGLIQSALLDPFTKNNLQLEAEVQPNLPSILVDPSKLKDVLVELFRNAAEAAGPAGGRAMLKIAGPGVITPVEQNRVDILISNTGTPLPVDKLPNAFRAFQGSKSTNHLGLGLTIASMLTHQMGLQLGLASENGTTTAWLSCPVA
jgi:signal transduction histidine kinase